MSEKGWNFPDAHGGQTQGFNDSSIDTFKGSRLQSLVRETIQNSLDARKAEDQPVQVDFSIVELEKKHLEEVTALVPFLKYAQRTALTQSDRSSEAYKFYDRAIKSIEENSKFPIFCISDFNTLGLEGSTDEDSFEVGPWKALVKGSGLSVKNRSDALGSFGHGSKATFAISAIRTVFYYSEILLGSKTERRFQGKSILQSMKTNLVKKTQGVGYFGSIKKCEPLINDEIPNWTRSLRDSSRGKTGTSIFIPFPDITINVESLWQEIELSILSNFYYAIRMGNLEISFNGNTLFNKGNLGPKFNELLQRIQSTGQRIEKEVREALQTAITIHSPSQDLFGSWPIRNFGDVQFYMRIGKEIEGRTVGIARQNGMLLTRRPLYLTRFSGTQPFDLFVCISDNNGSSFLRRLENPAHDNFEFDRINDPDERRKFKSDYRRFTDQIRELVDKYASINSSDEVITDDLDDFLGVSDSNLDSDAGNENSNSLLIEEKKASIKKPNLMDFDAGYDDIFVAPGESQNVAKGGKSSREGLKLPGSANARQSKEVIDPRIVRIGKNKAKVFFTPDTKSAFWLKLFRSGNQVIEELKFRVEGELEFKTETFFPERKRVRRESLVLELQPSDFNYAIEIVSQLSREIG